MTALKLIGDSRPISEQSPVSCYYLNTTTYAYVSSQNTLVWMFLVRSRPNMSVMYILTSYNGMIYVLREPFYI